MKRKLFSVTKSINRYFVVDSRTGSAIIVKASNEKRAMLKGQRILRANGIYP